MMEIVDIVHIGANLGREEPGVEGHFLDAGVTVEPGEVGKCKGFRLPIRVALREQQTLRDLRNRIGWSWLRQHVRCVRCAVRSVGIGQ